MGDGEESQFISDVFILCDFTPSSRIRARENKIRDCNECNIVSVLQKAAT